MLLNNELKILATWDPKWKIYTMHPTPRIWGSFSLCRIGRNYLMYMLLVWISYRNVIDKLPTSKGQTKDEIFKNIGTFTVDLIFSNEERRLCSELNLRWRQGHWYEMFYKHLLFEMSFPGRILCDIFCYVALLN